jgi:HD-like signal output (HDOD) protein
MDFERIVKNVESLPPLSDTANIIQRLYADGIENININKLVIAIEADAVLTANILRMINSPLYGFSKKILNVSQAVTLFGVQMVYGLVVNYAISSVVVANLRPYGLSNSKFNEMCQLQSMLVKKWYGTIDSTMARFLTPLALIMESGKLLMAREITQSGKIKEFHEGLKEADDLAVYENRYFQTTSYFVSGLLFEHWNFEVHYVDTLKGLDFEYTSRLKELPQYIDILDVVRTAINVKGILSDKAIENAANLVFEMGLSKADFLEVAHEIKYTYENEGR